MARCDACLHERKRQRHEAENEGEDAQRDEAVVPSQHDAQRRADGNAAVGRDTVPGNHPRGVLAADPANTPGDRPGAYPAFGETEAETAEEDEGERQAGHLRHDRTEGKEQAGDREDDEAGDNGPFRPHGIGHPPRMRPAEQGRKILRADGKAGDDRGVAKVEVCESGQYGEGNADAQVADEGEDDRGKDARRHGEAPAAGGD
jgi:hypothetical protein